MYVDNPGPNTIYVGGKAIPPGEGRDIEDALLPPELRQVEAPAEPAPPSIDELLAKELKKTAAELIDGIQGYKLETLDRMAELEAARDKPRKTLLTAIDAERLRRASQTLDGGAGVEGGEGSKTGADSEGGTAD